jgi:hypothetical protein
MPDGNFLEFSSGIFFCLANSRAPRTRELPGGNFLEKVEGPGLPGRGLRIPVCFPKGNSLWFVGFPNCRYGFRHSLFPNCRIPYTQGDSRIAGGLPIPCAFPGLPTFPVFPYTRIPLHSLYSRLPVHCPFPWAFPYIPDCLWFPIAGDSQRFPIPSNSWFPAIPRLCFPRGKTLWFELIILW